jgi:hypothetical protein
VAKKPTITEKIMFTQEKAAAFSCVNCRTFNGKMKGERKKCTLLVAKTCTLLVAKTCTFLIAKSCTLLFTVYTKAIPKTKRSILFFIILSNPAPFDMLYKTGIKKYIKK